MSWVVDTCVLIDVLEDDPDFGRSSALCLKHYLKAGLVLSPVSMIELSPAFEGDLSKQKAFLSLCGVEAQLDAHPGTLARAHCAWNQYIKKKRLRQAAKRPVADIMIGAFACRFDGLITRNAKDFETWFPELRLIDPMEDGG